MPSAPDALWLLLDENLSWRVARGLATAGYQVMTVAEIGLMSAADSLVFAHAREHNYVLITRDSDFLTRFSPPHHGIIVVRCPSSADNAFILRCLLAHLPALFARELDDGVWPIECS
jgi:predicted nuclease of predicted toxin-antitoxin system